MYKTILVPLDGSKRAERILPYVEEIALAHESVVVLLHVMEPAIVVAGPYDTVLRYDREEAERGLAEAKQYLETVVAALQVRGVAARYVIESGPVTRAILVVAAREQADLIAMASHGRTGLARVFYGSVAAGILQQADRPLLLVRAAGLV